LMWTLPFRGGAPVPSTMVPPRMRTSVLKVERPGFGLQGVVSGLLVRKEFQPAKCSPVQPG
jgi:hypothetical protein